MRRLLIRSGAIGDCILSLPALEHLAAEYTEVWTPRAIVPLIRFADAARAIPDTGLDLVGVGDLEMTPLLKASLQGFDSIVSWYGANRPEFREALVSADIACCEFHPALPPPDGNAGHAIDFYAQQVGAPEGLVPRIAIAASGARESIVVHPFSGGRRKNWPLHSYRDLGSRLPLEIEWTAGPEEALPEAIRFANLDDLAAWIAGARLYIGNDSGITHLAAATGVRTLALFGPLSPSAWEPRGENVTVLRANSIEALSVGTVLAAVNGLVSSERSACGRR